MIHASATSLDLAARTVALMDGRPPLAYDVLSLDVDQLVDDLAVGCGVYKNLVVG